MSWFPLGEDGEGEERKERERGYEGREVGGRKENNWNNELTKRKYWAKKKEGEGKRKKGGKKDRRRKK